MDRIPQDTQEGQKEDKQGGALFGVLGGIFL